MTDAEEQRTRPNANYKLSRSDKVDPHEEEGITFHYNRERRLAKAPQAVKDLYKEKKQHNRFNLFRPLVADKPRAMLFFTIVVICAMIILLSILGFFQKTISLDGNKLAISGTAFEGTTIVVLRKSAPKTSAYSGAVDIAVSPAAQSEDDRPPVFFHRIFFSLEPAEEYRFVAPFDAAELLIVLQTEKSTVHYKFKPD